MQETAREIDIAVREMIDRAFDRAIEIRTRQRDVLEDTAKRLLAQETLSEDELPKLPLEPGAATAAAQ